MRLFGVSSIKIVIAFFFSCDVRQLSKSKGSVKKKKAEKAHTKKIKFFVDFKPFQTNTHKNQVVELSCQGIRFNIDKKYSLALHQDS